ncbi:MAG: hypothetical protein U1C33_04890, partial [Candidatus Cloacimonadaceae bacterium]|nr:hypothetical protein [Candidatus Cloacimonadaceae bacterium]
MRKLILITMMLLMVCIISAQVIRTCREIQETTHASGDSPFVGQQVTVQGIVTATRYYTGSSATNFGFFISDPEGGPWSGLFIFTNQHQPALGDLVQVTGTIIEYFGFTEMSPVSTYQVLSQGNPIPEPTLITTGQLATAATAEQWESVLVKVLNSTVTSLPNSYQEFNVNDGTGNAQIDNQCFTPGHVWTGITMNQTWAEIRGVVDYSFNIYAINPRSNVDMIQEYTLANSSIQIQSIPNGQINQLETMKVSTSRLRPSYGVEKYSMTLKFDPKLVKFEGIIIDSTITLSQPEWDLSADESTLTISYHGYESGDYQGPIITGQDGEAVIYLQFRPLNYGDVLIRFDSFKYNETDIATLTPGTISVKIARRMAFLNISNSNNHKNIFNPQLNEKITIRYG